MKVCKSFSTEENIEMIAPVIDSLELLIGKWKLPILMSLSTGDKRFNQLKKEISRISDMSLARELKDLEINQFVTRRVCDTFPPSAEYSITALGLSVDKIVNELRKWGLKNLQKYKNK